MKNSCGLELLPGPFGIFGHALEIQRDHRFVANNPRIVARRYVRHVARLEIELRAVVHADPQHAGDLILRVRHLALCRTSRARAAGADAFPVATFPPPRFGGYEPPETSRRRLSSVTNFFTTGGFVKIMAAKMELLVH